MDAIPALAIIFPFILAVVYIQNKSKENREKLRLLEEAIRGGHLDEQMRADLMYGLAGKRRPRRERSPFNLSRLLFGLGWMALFVGVGLLFAGDRDMFTGGCIVSGIGFGFVTMPLAYRELDSRHRQDG